MVQSINQNRYFWLGLMIAVLGVYGYRMWHFFPDQAPMDFDPKALLPQVIKACRLHCLNQERQLPILR